MCQVPKPFGSLLVDMMMHWDCSYHFFDPGVSDHVPACFVHIPTHFTGVDFAFKWLNYCPYLTLVYQDGDEDAVDEFGLDLSWDI